MNAGSVDRVHFVRRGIDLTLFRLRVGLPLLAAVITWAVLVLVTRALVNPPLLFLFLPLLPAFLGGLYIPHSEWVRELRLSETQLAYTTHWPSKSRVLLVRDITLQRCRKGRFFANVVLQVRGSKMTLIGLPIATAETICRALGG